MFEILFGWRKASKCKRLIKCVRCRLKLLRSKRDVIVRQLRGDVAHLLKKGQDDSAFARVEQLIKDQNLLEAYALLDHFCEFIITNIPYIRRNRDCPNDLNEAISSLIFASARCADLPELQMLRKLFSKRYGNDFAVSAVELYHGNHVNQQITEKLLVKSVSYDTKLRLIDEIAEEYNLSIGYPEVEDSWNPVQYLQVYDPSIRDRNCVLEKQVSEKDIQVIVGNKKEDQVHDSNDKEMLQLYQRQHFENTNLQQEKASYHSSSNCDKLVQNPSHCHDSASVISSSTGASVVGKCVLSNVPPLDSPALHACVQEVDQINKSDPSYERISVNSDSAEAFYLNIQDNNESKDERGSNSLQDNKWRQTCEEKHPQQNMSNQPKIKIAATGSFGEGKLQNDHVNCENPSKASEEILSNVDLDDFEQKLEGLHEFNDGSVTSRHCHKRRKSVSTISRRRSISGQSELYGGCADIHDLNYFHRKGQRLSREIHHQWDGSSMLESKKDMEYALYYDESYGDSDAYFVDPKEESSHFHRVKQNGDYFSRKHCWHSTLNLADGLYLRSGLCRKRHQEITSGSGKLQHPCPQPYSPPRRSGDICYEVIVRSTSHGYNYRRRSCSSCSWDDEMVHECCLEHPCYSLARENRSDRESSSPSQCYSNNNGCRRLSTVIHQGNFKSLENEKASTARQCMDSSSNVDITNDSTCNKIASENPRLKEHKHKEVKTEASDHCDDISLSHVSNSTEIPPPSSDSLTQMRPPYLRAVTMPLPGRPKITLTNQTSRSTSFQLQQSNCHVHPKLPDYDDLAAKFMALKKEHLHNSTHQASKA